MYFLLESELCRLHFGLRFQFTVTLVPKEVRDWLTERFVHSPDRFIAIRTSSCIMFEYELMYMHPQVLMPQNAFFPCQQEVNGFLVLQFNYYFSLISGMQCCVEHNVGSVHWRMNCFLNVKLKVI